MSSPSAEEAEAEIERLGSEEFGKLEELGVVGLFFDYSRGALIVDIDPARQLGVDPDLPAPDERERMTSEARARAERELPNLTEFPILVDVTWGLERIGGPFQPPTDFSPPPPPK
jgi:hypothetical protein